MTIHASPLTGQSLNAKTPTCEGNWQFLSLSGDTPSFPGAFSQGQANLEVNVEERNTYVSLSGIGVNASVNGILHAGLQPASQGMKRGQALTIFAFFFPSNVVF